ncbi:MAG: O-antigen ligase family protein [Chloroflexota bacterium]
MLEKIGPISRAKITAEKIYREDILPQRGRIIRVSLAIFALVAAALLPIYLVDNPSHAPILLVLPILVIAINYVSDFMGIGMAFILIAAIFINFQIGTGTGSSVNAAMIALVMMIGLWALDFVVNQKTLKIYSPETFTPLILFILFACISLLVGQFAWYSFAEETSIAAQLGGLSIFIFSAAAFWWVGSQIHSINWLVIGLAVLLVGGMYYYILRVAPGEISSILTTVFAQGAAGSMLFLWSGAMGLSQALVNTKLHWFWRAACLSVPLMALYVAFFILRGWVSGYLPLIAAMGVIVWLAYPKQGVLFATVGALAGIFQLQFILQNYILIGDNEYSLGTRLDAWAIVGEITSISPVFGLGPANYYNITPLFPIRGYAVQFNSHSQYVDLYAQVGIVGLVLFLWFLFRVGKLSWNLRKKVKPSSFEDAYLIGVLGGLVGTIVSSGLGDWVLPFVYNVGFNGFRSSIIAWLFMGGVVAIKRLSSEAEAEST